MWAVGCLGGGLWSDGVVDCGRWDDWGGRWLMLRRWGGGEVGGEVVRWLCGE